MTDVSAWREVGYTSDGGSVFIRDQGEVCPEHGDTLESNGGDEYFEDHMTCFYPGCTYELWVVG